MAQSVNPDEQTLPQRTELLGHPTGLFTLFFVEMWERFSYYGMRAILVFYMTKGFLGYGDRDAYAVYGSYTALVYMTPFIGGMLADRILGTRRAVILGGLLMSAGHLLMMWEAELPFFVALALIIVGNGLFKPNISTIVGTLYAPGSPTRDGGFTIFYMGVNLGAAMAPLLCGYIGETYGWHKGFGLATAGMLAGLAVFVSPRAVAQFVVAATAIYGARLLWTEHPDERIATMINGLMVAVLSAAAVIACWSIGRGGLPRQAGEPTDPARLRAISAWGIPREYQVYLLILAAVPVFALFVSGLAPFRADHRGIVLISDQVIDQIKQSSIPAKDVLAVVCQEASRPAGLVLLICGLGATAFLLIETFRLAQIARHRMIVVLTLTFFSVLFWAFFEQAGSSINNFTDRNVDRILGADARVTQEQVGTTIKLEPTQEQLGFHNGDDEFTMSDLNALRREHQGEESFSIDWQVATDNVGMYLARQKDETPASTFQAVNPIFILLFGLLITFLWTFLGRRGIEPSTPLKFALGILQIGLGFGALWYGTLQADARGMVHPQWLILGYLLHTTGELCLSPVGLSMVTKLSPKHLVATTMGAWFLATAFAQLLAAMIAQFTGVEGHGAGESVIPAPSQTLTVYGDVFRSIAILALGSSAVCFILVPFLSRWTHPEVKE